MGCPLNGLDGVVRYHSEGRISIDASVGQRLLRPVAIGGRDYLFMGSEKGGKTVATLHTLVSTARRNRVDMRTRQTDALAALESLLPDRCFATTRKAGDLLARTPVHHLALEDLAAGFLLLCLTYLFFLSFL
jgi:hypothetical protein